MSRGSSKRDGARFAAIRKNLIVWFRQFQRDLPWRRTRDPYKIWVAEVMLQQTQVETVKPYYERFLEKFPTVRKLAAASLDDLLKAWEGLGYYARARHLRRAAQLMVREYGGKIPAEREKLLTLPGIGPYTAGAMLSIAFGQDEPALDGNSERVLARLFAIEQDPKERATQKRLWQLARDLSPPGQAGVFNQALMDLGAMICIPGEPRCLICPLARWCAARRRGLQAELPIRPARKALPHHEVAVGIIWKNKKILIARRPEEGLLGGLWEFPGGKREPGESLPACLEREICEELGIRVEVGDLFLTIGHGYSHFRVTLHAFQCRFLHERPRAVAARTWRWVKPEELDRYAFPSANQKILRALKGKFATPLKS
jgi:A/G-specific adenine glycosylase